MAQASRQHKSQPRGCSKWDKTKETFHSLSSANVTQHFWVYLNLQISIVGKLRGDNMHWHTHTDTHTWLPEPEGMIMSSYCLLSYLILSKVWMALPFHYSPHTLVYKAMISWSVRKALHIVPPQQWLKLTTNAKKKSICPTLYWKGFLQVPRIKGGCFV